jgi:hypothetical protein
MGRSISLPWMHYLMAEKRKEKEKKRVTPSPSRCHL